MRENPQPVDALARARIGERWVVRRRLPDGSATDLIGWLDRVEPDAISLATSQSGAPVTVPVTDIIVARRAPAAAGGPDPLRTTADELERFALPGWLAWSEPLGEWTLRAGGGFTARANSVLAVGDPGVPLVQAAARVVEFSAAHRIEPQVQVIAESAAESGLRQLDWVGLNVESIMLGCRLSTVLGESLPNPDVEIRETLSSPWMAAYQRSSPNDADQAIVQMILQGNPPTAFAGIPAMGRLAGIGRGHVSGPWLGLHSMWTDDAHGAENVLNPIMIALGHWGARRGARYGYIEVLGREHETLETCLRLGFRPHHRNRYLRKAG